jgi:hypothetical protein
VKFAAEWAERGFDAFKFAAAVSEQSEEVWRYAEPVPG